MHVFEVNDLINHRMTYRSGWSFEAYSIRSNRADHPFVTRVDWEALVENSSPRDVDSRPEVIASGTFEVIPGSQRYVEDQILQGIQEAEAHELREFLRFDGVAPYHPHREDGRIRWSVRTR